MGIIKVITVLSLMALSWAIVIGAIYAAVEFLPTVLRGLALAEGSPRVVMKLAAFSGISLLLFRPAMAVLPQTSVLESASEPMMMVLLGFALYGVAQFGRTKFHR